MMSKLVCLFLLCLSSICLNAQDLILTREGDSLNCKITKVKRDFIYFKFIQEQEVRKTLLPRAEVKEHKFNYFENGDFPHQKNKNYPLFRMAINGGFSYQPAKIHKSVPAHFRDYVRELKSGYHLGGDITYYPSEHLGVGLKYRRFMTSNSLNNVSATSIDGTVKYGTISDDLRIIFIGPAIATRLLNQTKRNALITNHSIGYMNYSNKQVVIDPQKVTGQALGLAFDVGYDIGLSKNLLLGLQISFISGVLKKYKRENALRTTTVILQRGNYESMHRLDFSIGLRFSK